MLLGPEQIACYCCFLWAALIVAVSPVAVLTGRNRNDFDRARWGRSNADNNLCIRRTGCIHDFSLFTRPL